MSYVENDVVRKTFLLEDGLLFRSERNKDKGHHDEIVRLYDIAYAISFNMISRSDRICMIALHDSMGMLGSLERSARMLIALEIRRSIAFLLSWRSATASVAPFLMFLGTPLSLARRPSSSFVICFSFASIAAMSFPLSHRFEFFLEIHDELIEDVFE